MLEKCVRELEAKGYTIATFKGRLLASSPYGEIVVIDPSYSECVAKLEPLKAWEVVNRLAAERSSRVIEDGIVDVSKPLAYIASRVSANDNERAIILASMYEGLAMFGSFKLCEPLNEDIGDSYIFLMDERILVEYDDTFLFAYGAMDCNSPIVGRAFLIHPDLVEDEVVAIGGKTYYYSRDDGSLYIEEGVNCDPGKRDRSSSQE